MDFSIYIAASFISNIAPGSGKRYTRLEGVARATADHMSSILESYHYIEKDIWVNRIRAAKRRVFLDSGAFSAWTLGASIDLNAYCRYIKDKQDIILEEDGVLMASVLDGIGDPQLTLENQQAMERQGVTPLPCFHFGEDERYLEYYIANYPYITIGGMVGKSTGQLKLWLDRIWNKYLLDENGQPRLKVHAFGITSVDIMSRYPWRSVDSSSWVQFGMFGNIWSKEFGTLAISEHSPARHQAGRHYDNITDIERQVVDKIIIDRGFDIHKLRTQDEFRSTFNIYSFELYRMHINQKRKQSMERHTPIKLELF